MTTKSDNPQQTTSTPGGLSPETAELILSAVSSLRFGAVEVTVHEGRVVQVDKRERVRITAPHTGPRK